MILNIKSKNTLYLATLLIVVSMASCYSFKGISIPPEANTYYVADFLLKANNAPPDVNQKFAEALRAKVRNESRLLYSETDPDITFEGSVSSYSVTGNAPQEGNTVALNKLTITVTIQYTNNTVEDDEWNQTFSFFKDFDATIDLNSVEDEFIDEIYEQLVENIFNKAFTDW